MVASEPPLWQGLMAAPFGAAVYKRIFFNDFSFRAWILCFLVELGSAVHHYGVEETTQANPLGRGVGQVRSQDSF